MKPAASPGGRTAAKPQQSRLMRADKTNHPSNMPPSIPRCTHLPARRVLATRPASTRERKRLLPVGVGALPRNHATRLTAQALLKMIGQPAQLQWRAENLGLLDTSCLRRLLAAAQSGWNRLPAGKIRRATALPAPIQHAQPGANDGFIRVHPQKSGHKKLF